ncbi:hypothetical protein STRAU_5611 [Streptomyces aurantiacus JA 4570]|uniref:Uncharacterized protein n=1 Tax=Streptomyces aurantiacus JA 4570 TaxID=1286094 RepID=S3ZSG3_9ACTN|nr:hypothetical protein STRAU_5611 [Streptomyces aurantiacus JA 4570]
MLLGSGITAATAGPAAASDTPISAARDCTQNAPRFTSWPGTGPNDPAFWPARGTYATTTPRCKDINLKLDSRREVRTCFKRGAGWNCNGWRWLAADRWGLAADNVLDGTKFFLQFKGTSRAAGLIDY